MADINIDSFDAKMEMSDRLGKLIDKDSALAQAYRDDPTEENLRVYLECYGDMLRLSTQLRRALDASEARPAPPA